jgi:hypothetical protein
LIAAMERLRLCLIAWKARTAVARTRSVYIGEKFLLLV